MRADNALQNQRWAIIDALARLAQFHLKVQVSLNLARCHLMRLLPRNIQHNVALVDSVLAELVAAGVIEIQKPPQNRRGPRPVRIVVCGGRADQLDELRTPHPGASEAAQRFAASLKAPT